MQTIGVSRYCFLDLDDRCRSGEHESKKGKGSPYSTRIAERRVPELIPVFGSQPAGDVSHIPGGRLPLLSAKRANTHRNP